MKKPFSYLYRQQSISHLKSSDEIFDVVIIGGGITGAGVARDAASRGMKVLLVEARDFAEGTSSRSSKLIHGGIRYLENLDFHLVFEALSERRLLFQMAPFLVHPLRFMIPLYRGGRVGMFKMGLGMWLYDALALFETPEMHSRLSAKKTLSEAPILRDTGLLGSYIYSDAYMDDDRLVLETLRAAHKLGACCLNFVKATSAEFDEKGKMVALQVRDEQSGQSFKVRARHFISTVGPWTDEVGTTLLGRWKKILRPSKGIHLTFHRQRLPLKNAVVMAAEGRIVFAIPRHEMVIVGTTDTDYPDAPENVHSAREDVDYLLKISTHYFPGANLREEDVIASYAGVRPLVDDGSVSESKTSREHVIINDERNITFVAGGKYTTYRRMAEQTVRSVLSHYFSVEDQVRFQKNDTRRPLNDLATVDSFLKCELQRNDWAREFNISPQEVQFLCDRHGEETVEILEKALTPKVRSLGPEERIWALEALHAIDQTMCLHLKDFYLRRTPLFLTRPDHGLALIPVLTDLFSQTFGWTDKQEKQEVNALQAHIEFELGWQKQRR